MPYNTENITLVLSLSLILPPISIPRPSPDGMDEMCIQIETVSSQLEVLRKHFDDPASSSASPHSDQNRPRLKLHVPRFDDTDTHGWIFKISQFITYHQNPPEERITIALFYLDGAALAWYQWMYCNHHIVSWP